MFGTEDGWLNGVELQIMDSAARADALIAAMAEAAAAGETDIDYSTEGMSLLDEARCDKAYDFYFG